MPLADRDDAVSEHFSSAPFIAVWDKGPDGAVISQEILYIPFRTMEKRKGISLATLEFPFSRRKSLQQRP